MEYSSIFRELAPILVAAPPERLIADISDGFSVEATVEHMALIRAIVATKFPDIPLSHLTPEMVEVALTNAAIGEVNAIGKSDGEASAEVNPNVVFRILRDENATSVVRAIAAADSKPIEAEQSESMPVDGLLTSKPEPPTAPQRSHIAPTDEGAGRHDDSGMTGISPVRFSSD